MLDKKTVKINEGLFFQIAVNKQYIQLRLDVEVLLLVTLRSRYSVQIFK